MDREILIHEISFPNKGVGFYEDKKVVIPYTLPGQRVLARLKKKKEVYEGRLLHVIENSSYEIKPDCSGFGSCGGCAYQNIPYDKELEIKEETVLALLRQEEIAGFEYLGISPAPSTSGYRNKMEFSFGDEEKEGPLALGMRRRHSNYEVVTSSQCNIVDEDYRIIMLATLEFFQNSGETFYRKTNHKGALRNLVIRKGFFTGEILVNIVTSSALQTELEPYAALLTALRLDGRIAGILHTVNDSLADVVKSDESHILYGRDYYMERLLGMDFKISAFSFFQTNSAGAEKLYTTVRQFAGEDTLGTIFDLYCGTGTIAQVLASKANTVVGAELVEEAVASATENAKLNRITNCRFISGDVLKTLDQLEETPDLIILDPPRDGVHPKALNKIADFGSKKIIYVSCKPTSLARDLKALNEKGYVVEKIRCHDMFPRTWHVECVCLLEKQP